MNDDKKNELLEEYLRGGNGFVPKIVLMDKTRRGLIDFGKVGLDFDKRKFMLQSTLVPNNYSGELLVDPMDGEYLFILNTKYKVDNSKNFGATLKVDSIYFGSFEEGIGVGNSVMGDYSFPVDFEKQITNGMGLQLTEDGYERPGTAFDSMIW